jgi:hypothetical protein
MATLEMEYINLPNRANLLINCSPLFLGILMERSDNLKNNEQRSLQIHSNICAFNPIFDFGIRIHFYKLGTYNTSSLLSSFHCNHILHDRQHGDHIS